MQFTLYLTLLALATSTSALAIPTPNAQLTIEARGGVKDACVAVYDKAKGKAKDVGSACLRAGDHAIDRTMNGIERAGRASEKASELKENIRNKIKGPRSVEAKEKRLPNMFMKD